MHANACQLDKAVEADLASLCASCARKGRCLKELAARNIGERMDDGAYQIQLLDECEDYANDGSGSAAHGNLRPAAFAAGVRDLCCGCPGSSDCRKRHDLDAFARAAIEDGAFVHVSVLTCRPKTGGLLQISEPRK